MKKFISVVCASALVFGTFTAVHCEDDVKVELDGSELVFDVPPQIIEGRTLVPLRVIFEALGAEVDWNGDTRTVTAVREDIEISMTIGDNVMRVNAEEISLDVPPQIIDDRTLVPARAVAEGFGAEVDWNGDTRTVLISTQTAAEETSEPSSAEETSEPSSTEEPSAEETAAPTEAPSASAAPEQEKDELPVVYDEASDLTSEIVTNFKILSVNETESGDYEVEFRVDTFLESTGDATTKFICLDEDGKEVDSWERIYKSTAYTPTQQEDKVTISGKTKTIVCASK